MLNAQQGSVINLGSKTSWEPYHIDTGDGTDGIAVRALACIMARLNQPYVIYKLPWTRAQRMTQVGQLDGFFYASQNRDRDEYAILSDLFLPQTRTFYSLKSKVTIGHHAYNLAFVRDLPVGARLGANALVQAKRRGFNVTMTAHDSRQLFSQLEAERVEAIIENSVVFEAEIKLRQYKLNQFHRANMEVKNMGVYFGKKFLNSTPSFLEAFNRHVAPCSLLNVE